MKRLRFTKLDFLNPGVKVVTFGTMKGLECDIVIIPNIDLIKSERDRIRNNNKIYVAMTRAKEELYMIYRDLEYSPDKWIDVSLIEDNSPLFEWMDQYPTSNGDQYYGKKKKGWDGETVLPF